MACKFACLLRLRKLASACTVYKCGIWSSFEKFFNILFETRQKLCLKTVAQKWDGFSIVPTGASRPSFSHGHLFFAVFFRITHDRLRERGTYTTRSLTGFGKSLIFQLLPCQWRHKNINFTAVLILPSWLNCDRLIAKSKVASKTMVTGPFTLLCSFCVPNSFLFCSFACFAHQIFFRLTRSLFAGYFLA